jgi:lysozyme
MTFTTSPEGQAIIKAFESCKLVAYKDVVGVPTIGWGCTGPNIQLGLRISQEQADFLFTDRLQQEFEPAVNRYLDGAPTHQKQFDAMVSLAYNIGVGAFHRSMVLYHHVEQDYDLAANSFANWVHAGGRILSGLVKRRQSEAALYRQGTAYLQANDATQDGGENVAGQ